MGKCKKTQPKNAGDGEPGYGYECMNESKIV